MIRNVTSVATMLTALVVASASYVLARLAPQGDWQFAAVAVIPIVGLITFLIASRLISWHNRREIYSKWRLELEAEEARIVAVIVELKAQGKPASLVQFENGNPITEEALNNIRKRKTHS